MFKKIVLICSFLFLFGCTKKASIKAYFQKNEKVKVLCTLSMIEDLVKQVGQEHVDTLSLIQGDLDPHSYELCKGDDEKIYHADIFFYNGLGLEHGASLNYHLKKSTKSIALGEFVSQKRLIEVEGVVDPHIWMDVSLWSEIIDPIVFQLSQKDPKNARSYFENGQKLKAKMETLHQAILSEMMHVNAQKRQLITTHDAFHYFVKAYMAKEEEIEQDAWMVRLIAPEGLAPEGQVSTVDVKRILDFARLNQTHVVFAESNLSQTSLKKIVDAAKKNGLTLRIAKKPLYGDAMMKTEDPFSYGKTLMYNAITICENLKGEMNE